ncbi:hypothetical protein C8R28_101061 [Nitrosomonas ureae]|uniref:Uncharacterized protein n=1 Tax=Nitrosomonas ureae TaxID=44577 RepID=A0A286A735_9PROT|nr:hypothetical protein C8R28_101061 [Nitrosomonas ureae]SOD17722.1 hypothetical protein SAMN06297164_1315 [Nitrosomonas ureae]
MLQLQIYVFDSAFILAVNDLNTLLLLMEFYVLSAITANKLH